MNRRQLCFSPALDLPHILMCNRARHIAEDNFELAIQILHNHNTSVAFFNSQGPQSILWQDSQVLKRPGISISDAVSQNPRHGFTCNLHVCDPAAHHHGNVRATRRQQWREKNPEMITNKSVIGSSQSVRSGSRLMWLVCLFETWV